MIDFPDALEAQRTTAQARVAAAGMLMDRAWGKAHQSTDTTITEQRAYVLCPPTMEDQEWKDYLEFKRPQLSKRIESRLRRSGKGSTNWTASCQSLLLPQVSHYLN